MILSKTMACLTLLLASMALAITDYERNTISQELNHPEKKGKFCGKGLGFLSTTIRSESGKYCELEPTVTTANGWGPWLAKAICWDYKGWDNKAFPDTECGKKIGNRNGVDIGRLKIDSAELCNFLTKFVTLDACRPGGIKLPEPNCEIRSWLQMYVEINNSNNNKGSGLSLGNLRSAIETKRSWQDNNFIYQLDSDLNQKSLKNINEILSKLDSVTTFRLDENSFFKDDKCHYSISVGTSVPSNAVIPFYMKVTPRY